MKISLSLSHSTAELGCSVKDDVLVAVAIVVNWSTIWFLFFLLLILPVVLPIFHFFLLTIPIVHLLHATIIAKMGRATGLNLTSSVYFIFKSPSSNNKYTQGKKSPHRDTTPMQTAVRRHSFSPIKWISCKSVRDTDFLPLPGGAVCCRGQGWRNERNLGM